MLLFVNVEHAGHIVCQDPDQIAPDKGQEMKAGIIDCSKLYQVDMETGFLNCLSTLRCEGSEVSC